MLIILIHQQLRYDENKLILDWKLKKDKKIILMPGRLTAWKGQNIY